MTDESHKIAVIPGDLNGITVTNAVLELSKAVAPTLNKQIVHTELSYNADYFLEHNITELGEKELDELKKYDQIFLGAVGDPTKVEPGVLELGILLKVRQEFDQYVNLRPVVLPKGVPSILVGKGSEDINFEICRENSEGLYCGIGWIENKGTDNEVAYQLMRCSYKGVKRLAEFAEQRAFARKKSNKPTLHFVFKTNILKYAASPWIRVIEEYSKRSDIDIKLMHIKPENEIQIGTRYMHVDNFGMQMIIAPEQFDVVLTENMFGDIMTDIGAVLQGGIETAVSGNINPTGKFPSMFEPIHGSAPNKWYEMDENKNYIPGTFLPDMVQLIKPEAAFLSYAMMLHYLEEDIASEAINEAALANIRDPNYKTMNLNVLVEKACRHVVKAIKN